MAEPTPAPDPAMPDEETLREGLEMLLLAAKTLADDAERDLAREGMGQAHLRALFLIGRHPGLTVSDLLSLLGVTKQSLARVLADLIAERHVAQTPGTVDRRRRHLYLTESGQILEARLTGRQRARLGQAFAAGGPDAAEAFTSMARLVLDSGLRAWVARNGRGR